MMEVVQDTELEVERIRHFGLLKRVTLRSMGNGTVTRRSFTGGHGMEPVLLRYATRTGQRICLFYPPWRKLVPEEKVTLSILVRHSWYRGTRVG